MERSLSILLATRNSQDSLPGQVQQLTEVLPELTAAWEIVLVDDGSTDATFEIADELSRVYPQVRAFPCRRARGRVEALRQAAHRSRGEWLCVADPRCPLSPHALGRMWEALAAHDIVLGCRAGAIPGSGDGRCGYVMLKRRNAEPLLPYLGNLDRLPEALRRLEYGWEEVELHTSEIGRKSLTAESHFAHHGQAEAPGGPNFLGKVRNFALGE